MTDRRTSSEMFDATDPTVQMCVEVMSSSVQRIADVAFTSGAAVAFGLMGMFEAIKMAEETREWEAFEAAEREAHRLSEERMDRALERERRGY